KDGKPACTIVIPANPTTYETRCAELLKLYLKIVTGAEFEIKPEPLSKGPAIYIGNTEIGKKAMPELPPVKYGNLTLPNLHGFMVKTVNPSTLVIRGNRDIGNNYATYSFIREYLGVRRYWPSEPGGIGDVFEKRPTLTAPRLTWIDWPYLISRHVGFNPKGWELTHKEGEPPWMFFWYRCGTTLSMMHNFFVLISPEEYGKTHPEYFPEINGERLVPTKQIHWQPCVSNPEVVEICANKIIAAFDKDPNRICHALSVNDGAGHCECANCRAMDAPESDINTTQLTDRYVKFMNAVAERVAEKHPNRLIGFLAYGGVRFPPSTVKLHPNLVPYFCAMGQGLYHGWDAWMAAGAKNMGHYGYHDDRWFIIPKINPHQEARRIRYMVGSGVQRGYYKEFNPTYPLDAHAAIVNAELQWDPRLDEDKILERYYSDMFGESAKEMRMFYELLEKDYEAWLKNTSPPHPYGPDRSDLDLDHDYEQFQVLTAKGADRAWEALLKADMKAKDPRVKERISIVKAIFEFVRMCDHEYWFTKELSKCKSASKAAELARKALRLARAKAEYKEKVMEKEPIKQWHMIYREPYDFIRIGEIPQEVLQAIDRGFETAFKANPKDPEWEHLAKDSDPVIAQSAQAVLAMALNKNLPNLAEDGDFENGTKPELRHDEPKQGSVAITREKPHSGKRCAVIWNCKSSNIVKRIPAMPGEKFLISVWLRSLEYPGPNNVPALYGIRVNAKKGDKTINWIREPLKPT
ncbi:MAG: DUF4838 domain-containing protein, partial [Armatimonadota bacterium]|nr:DUF4838 domain-containing protein [Armatimonadota bacterium]